MSHRSEVVSAERRTSHDRDSGGSNTSSAPSTSLLSTPREKHPKHQVVDVENIQSISKWQRIQIDTWTLEFVAFTLSVACMCAIVGILYHYSNAPTPQLPYHITLNAIVSTIGTAARSLLLSVVASALGQLKWCWFQKTRRLRDMDDLDQASRGPMGSLWIIGRFFTMPFITIGALVMIIALAFDPFIQQIIRYPSRIITSRSNESFLPQAAVWNVTAPTNENSDYVLTPEDGAFDGVPFFNAITTGIWSNESQMQVQSKCAGGSCEWPAFRSVGWCSKCVNATSYATLSNCNQPNQSSIEANSSPFSGCSVSFGHGNSSGGINGTILGQLFLGLTFSEVWTLHDPTLPLNVTAPASPAFPDVEYPLLDLAYAKLESINTDPNNSYIAIIEAEECVLSLCERNYTANFINATLHLKEESINYGQLSRVVPPDAFPYGQYAEPPIDHPGTYVCWQARPGQLSPLGVGFSDSAWGDTFTDDPQGITFWTDAALGAICPADPYGLIIANQLNGSATNSSTTGIMEGGGSSTNDEDPWFSSDNMVLISQSGLQAAVEGVAASLTNLAFQSSNQTITGNVTSVESYVHVTWEWLILPLVLEVLGLVVLIAAIVQSSKQKLEIWRTSLLPLLFHALEHTESSGSHTTSEEISNTLSSMLHAAKDKRARLTTAEDGRAVLVAAAPALRHLI